MNISAAPHWPRAPRGGEGRARERRRAGAGAGSAQPSPDTSSRSPLSCAPPAAPRESLPLLPPGVLTAFAAAGGWWSGCPCFTCARLGCRPWCCLRVGPVVLLRGQTVDLYRTGWVGRVILLQAVVGLGDLSGSLPALRLQDFVTTVPTALLLHVGAPFSLLSSLFT